MKKLIIVSILGMTLVSFMSASAETCPSVLAKKKPVKQEVKVASKKAPLEKIVIINNNTNVNNNVNNNNTPQKIKVVEKRVVIERSVRREDNKNIITVLGGRTVTGLASQVLSPTSIRAYTYGQVDVGLMYQRSLSEHWKASVIGTKNGSFYGGIGYGF